jgi:hypothetical protein
LEGLDLLGLGGGDLISNQQGRGSNHRGRTKSPGTSQPPGL